MYAILMRATGGAPDRERRASPILPPAAAPRQDQDRPERDIHRPLRAPVTWSILDIERGGSTGSLEPMTTASAEQAVLDGVKTQLYIDGAWRDAGEGGTIPVEDPATGEAIREDPG